MDALLPLLQLRHVPLPRILLVVDPMSDPDPAILQELIDYLHEILYPADPLIIFGDQTYSTLDIINEVQRQTPVGREFYQLFVEDREQTPK